MNLKLVANFLCELANVGLQIKETKNYAALAMLMDEGAALASVDWKALPEEVKNYDADDLSAAIKAKLDFTDDVLEEKAEKVLTVVLKIGELGMDLYEVFKKDEQA